MQHCKTCGHASGTNSTFIYDEWEFLICPNCGGEDIIDFEEEEKEYLNESEDPCESNQLIPSTHQCQQEKTLKKSPIQLNTIAGIAGCIPALNNGQIIAITDAQNVAHPLHLRNGE